VTLLPRFPVATLVLALLLPGSAVAQSESPPPAASPPPASAVASDEMPVYPRAVTVSSMKSATQGTILTLRSDDAPAAILDWYDAELTKRGWRVERRNEASGRHLLTALEGARKASLLITTKVSAANADRDESQIMLVVTEER